MFMFESKQKNGLGDENYKNTMEKRINEFGF